MGNLSDFLPLSGGGGLTPKFEEFNSSGTFTPTQALIDAGGYIEIFLVAGGAGWNNSDYQVAGGGGEVIMKKMYLTSTTGCSVTIGGGGSAGSNGGNSVFSGSSAGGVDVTATGGNSSKGQQNSQLGSTHSSYGGSTVTSWSAGPGVFGYGAGGAMGGGDFCAGVRIAKANSGQGGGYAQVGGSGYCLIKYYE